MLNIMYMLVEKLTLQFLAGVLIFYNRKRGMVTSSTLFYFWMILSICGAIQFRSEINKATKPEFPSYSSSYGFISYMIYYPLIVIQFLLSCFADQPPAYVEDPISKVSLPKSSYIFGLRFHVFIYFYSESITVSRSFCLV